MPCVLKIWCYCAAASTDPDLIFNAYKALNFEGLSGTVRLNQTADTRDYSTTNIVLRNLQPGAETKYVDVAQYDGVTDSLKFYGKQIVYWDGSTTAPSADWPANDGDDWWKAVWFIAIVTSIFVLVSLGVSVYIWKQKQEIEEMKQAKDKQETESRLSQTDESIMLGVSLGYLLTELEEDAHKVTEHVIKSETPYLSNAESASWEKKQEAEEYKAAMCVDAAKAELEVAKVELEAVKMEPKSPQSRWSQLRASTLTNQHTPVERAQKVVDNAMVMVTACMMH